MEHPENKIITGDIIQCHNKEKWTVKNISNIKSFTEDDIERITSNYSILIGKGGFGEVYRGVLDDNQHLVAVKRYIRGDWRQEFMEEVSIHSQMNHNNVLKLIGCCVGESNLVIVSEYIPKGNLDDMLHSSDISIPLDTRLAIAIGCADALSYMHSMHLSTNSLVCHGDIKPANILLDDKLNAKVSDFGLSTSLVGGISRYTRTVKGSLDYMDPMYIQEGRVTPKSDVYSFGVVLLELITRKKVKQGGISLITAFRKTRGKGKLLKELFDTQIAIEDNMKILEEIGKLATACVELDIAKRPHMNDVAERLRMLTKFPKGGHNKTSWLSFRRTHNALQKYYKKGTSISSNNSAVDHNKSLDISKRSSGNNDILMTELGNVRKFTVEELNKVTQNYLYLLGTGGLHAIYKGTLEDNTLVVVLKKFWDANEAQKHEFVKSALIFSKISHENIAKLIGCCLEADIPIFVYEHATKGDFHAIMQGKECLPLEMRITIAVQTAKALNYLLSSRSSSIRFCHFVPSDILLDDNFKPKVIPNCFSPYWYSITSATSTDLVRYQSDDMNYLDPIFLSTWGLTDKNVVYSFGITLLELISRKTLIMYDSEYGRLVPEFIQAYRTFGSGKVMFDEDITDEEEIEALEVIGRLALRCINLEEYERPSMKEVVAYLETLSASWKKEPADATAVEKKEPANATDDEKKEPADATADDSTATENIKPDAPLGPESETSNSPH